MKSKSKSASRKRTAPSGSRNGRKGLKKQKKTKKNDWSDDEENDVEERSVRSTSEEEEEEESDEEEAEEAPRINVERKNPFEALMGSLLVEQSQEDDEESEDEADDAESLDEEDSERAASSSNPRKTIEVVPEEDGDDSDAEETPDQNEDEEQEDVFHERFGPTKLAEKSRALSSSKEHKLGLYLVHERDATPESGKPFEAVKSSLRSSWLAYASRASNRKPTPSAPRDPKTGFTELQAQVLATPVLETYRDVVFSAVTPENASEVRETYVLHALNHVLKARHLVRKHDAAVSARKKRERTVMNAKRSRAKLERGEDSALIKEALNGFAKTAIGDEDEAALEALKDQGFTRPRVVIVVPTRYAAYRVLTLLMQLLPKGFKVQNEDKFREEFAGDLDPRAFVDELNEADFEAGFGAPAESEKHRPSDWRAFFRGNTDETFGVGVAFTTRQTMRLHVDFSKADIIVASPLGLRRATRLPMLAAHVGKNAREADDDGELRRAAATLEGEDDPVKKEEEDPHAGKPDVDFLSSIELLVLDQTETFHMQNWQHVEDLCAVGLNLRPGGETRLEIDFSRVADRFLEDQAKLFRQTLLFSAYPDRFLNALAHETCTSFSGKLEVRPSRYAVGAVDECARSDLIHVFRRIQSVNGKDEGSSRLEFFLTKIVPSFITQSKIQGTLLVLPTYFDFVRVRNALTEAHPEGFAACSEYATSADVSRARSAFYHGRVSTLVVTERWHFYHRYVVKGCRRVIFYAPPAHASYYSEMVDFCQGDNGDSPTAVTLFLPNEALELERLVGTKRASKMLAPTSASTEFKVHT